MIKSLNNVVRENINLKEKLEDKNRIKLLLHLKCS